MELLLIAIIVFFACFTQTASGFGIGLVGMPLLVSVVGLGVARPLMALVSFLNRIIMMIRYREQLTFLAAWRLMAGAAVGIPIGFLLLRQFDGRTVEIGLGVFLVVYAIYSLVSPYVPEFKRQIWAYGLGLASGVLAGAYNSGGPPVVIYAHGQRWSPQRFKGNVQGFTLLNSVLVMAIHYTDGNYTDDVMTIFVISIPAVLLGLYCGFKVDGILNPKIFRTIILGMLIVLGMTLIF